MTMETADGAYLDEPPAGGLTVGFKPNNETVYENPPRFVWLPVLDDTARYTIRVINAAGAVQEFGAIPRNFFTPSVAFAPGEYTWSYSVCSPQDGTPLGRWSRPRQFRVSADLPLDPLPPSDVRFETASKSHPRLWLSKGAARQFEEALRHDQNYCGFAAFRQASVNPFIDKPIHAEPAPYEGGVRTAPRWRAIYIECQEVLYAIRHMAIAGKLQNDAVLIARAKAWLLAVAAWDVKGTTSRAYNDEAAFRIATALAWGYDWLHDDLSADERNLVRAALLERTRDIADHVIEHARIHIFPYDSHAVRFLSAVLIPCCIALLHDAEEGEHGGPRAWLDYTVEYLFSIYTPWGGQDGGWAEGPHYWTLGMAYLLDAAELMKSYLGLDILQRPFFKKTALFPIYTKAPGTRRVSFGDDSTMGDLPSLKVGSNVRRLARAMDPHSAGYAVWYDEELKQQDPGTAKAFYNYGWWDFEFENLTLAHAGALPAKKSPGDMPSVAHFSDVGWVAIQRHAHVSDRHLQFVLKASPFGSLSHSHGDQGAFLLRAFGEDLAIQSGHYVAFNSAMHRDWRRQTRSKNAILIGGRGQYAGTDKGRAKSATGKILDVFETADAVIMQADTTAAYRSETPNVERVTRDVHFVRDAFFVIVDRVALGTPEPLQWLLHGARPFDVAGATFQLKGQRAGLTGQMVHASSGRPKTHAVSGFPGIESKELEGLALHHHVSIETPPARRSSMVTLLVPHLLNSVTRVLHYIDDQGYEARVTFVDSHDREYVVVVPKDL